DFTVIENGIEREPERVHIGNFPIMVKSKRCLLYKENMETEGELTSDEYKRKLIEMGEDPYDPGGYFIIGGTERALISLEDHPPNGIFTRDDAINYLEKKFATGQAKEYRIKKVESILDRSLLPHLGDTREDRIKKAIFLGRVARTVLELSLGMRREDDKDHYA